MGRYVAVVNGPNLNLLGRREPDVYGTVSLAEIVAGVKALARSIVPDTGVVDFQSNSEGELIDFLQRVGFDSDCLGVVINPGAYSHYSYALADAISAVPVRVVEVHLSNIHAREEFRRRSVTASSCCACVAGMGPEGYLAALRFLMGSPMTSAEG